MKKFWSLFAKIVCISILFQLNCKKIVEPISDEIPAKVEIEDVWLSDMIDHDNDGYYSDGRLYFDLGTNKIIGVQSFVWLGYKCSDYVDSNTYHKCFVTVDLTVKKNKDNIWYILISKFSDNLPHDNYDLMLVAKLSSAPEEYEDKEFNDEDIRNIPLEPPIEDTISVACQAFHLDNHPDHPACEALPSDAL